MQLKLQMSYIGLLIISMLHNAIHFLLNYKEQWSALHQILQRDLHVFQKKILPGFWKYHWAPLMKLRVSW